MKSTRSLLSLLFFVALLPTASAFAADDELAALVSRMARIGSCAGPSFAPDGKRLAVVCNLSGLPQVWVVSTAGGWPTQVTALDDQVSGVEWSPKEPDVLAFSLAPGGGLNEQVYVVRPDGLALQRITEGGKINNQLAGWTHDGRFLRLGSNRANPGSLDSYLFDVPLARLRLVAVNSGVGALTDVSRDDRWGLVNRVKSRGDGNIYLVKLKARGEILLTPHDPPGTFGGGTFSPDGQTVYLTSNKDRDRVAFARVRIDAAGTPGPIEVIAGRDDAELDNYEVADDGKTAALVWNVAGRSELAFLDLATGQETPGPKLPGDLVGGLDFSNDGTQLAMIVSGSTRPTDVWVLDRATNEIRQVTFSPHAGVALEDLVAPELMHLKAPDGTPISGWLYRARAKEQAPGPVVLSFHGGPEGQERPNFNSTYQALLARGISVFAPNVRGSSGFGKAFVNLDNGPLRVGAVRDIKVCIDYLVQEKIADPKRIGIMGGSYGGYMTMAGLAEYPDLFAAGANLFGVVNFETFFSHTEPWMAAISTIEYGDPATQKEMLRDLSPIHKVDRVKAPTLVLHGANDTNVPVVEAEQVVDSLKKRGIPVEYVLFPDEGHGFRKTPNRVRSTVAIVDWFDRYLNPGK